MTLTVRTWSPVLSLWWGTEVRPFDHPQLLGGHLRVGSSQVAIHRDALFPCIFGGGCGQGLPQSGQYSPLWLRYPVSLALVGRPGDSRDLVLSSLKARVTHRGLRVNPEPAKGYGESSCSTSEFWLSFLF